MQKKYFLNYFVSALCFTTNAVNISMKFCEFFMPNFSKKNNL